MKNNIGKGDIKKPFPTWVKWAVLGFVAVGLLIAGLVITPYVLRLEDPTIRAEFRQFVDNLGWWGVLLMLAIQFLQIILAIIPGEPIEILAGLLYGTWGGLAVCQIGIVLGQTAVFMLVRRFGVGFVRRFFGAKGDKELKLLKNPNTLDLTLFTLFFIPGTPKDVLCYVAPLTNVSLARFLLITGIARVPSVLSSTFAGATLGQGDIFGSIALFGVVAVLGIGGILLRQPVIRMLQRGRSK